MRRKTGLLRRVGFALVAATMALTISLPALANDDRPRGRDTDRDGPSRLYGVEWTKLLSNDLDGVEWTRYE